MPRLFSPVIPWATRFWVFFRYHLDRARDVYLLAGDAVGVSQAGKHTPGLERFFASLSGKPGPGLAFFMVSLVSIQERCSFPMHVEQVVRSPAEQAASQAQAEAKQRKPSVDQRRPGRPKGRPNNRHAEGALTPELQHISAMLAAFLKRLAGYLALTYVVLDGHFGHRHALPIARQSHLPLSSKRRGAAALYFPDVGPDAGRGPPRKSGHQVAYDHRPVPYLPEPTVAGHIQTRLYQVQLLHKEFAQPLNVVISAKIHLHTQAGAHVILFSSDLELGYAPLVAYYR